MADFTFEITETFGKLPENSNGWAKALNKVSWMGREPKYDLREWNPDHSRMGKGISLTEEEMERLVELWNTRNEEDSFEE